MAATPLGHRSARRDRRTRRLRRNHRKPAVPWRARSLRVRLGRTFATGLSTFLPRARREAPTRWPTSSCARSPCCPLAERWDSSPPTPSPKATPGRSGSTKWSKRDSRSHVPSRAGHGLHRLSTWSSQQYGAVVGRVADDVPRISDDEPVKRITTLLEPGGRGRRQPGTAQREREDRLPRLHCAWHGLHP